jgi:ribose-phosphate pyrophosphokinase
VADFFPMPGNEQLATDLAKLTSGEVGKLQVRRFPDGESYVRVLSDVKGKRVFLVCTLARPDAQFLALVFAAVELRQLGAAHITLIAPYLAYLRQDRIFHPGEALTSRTFAKLLQVHFDGLVTVAPHLHRHASLDEVYDVPSIVVGAGSLLAQWIGTHVQRPVVIGPDLESTQWVEAVAAGAGAPWTVFEKRRRGDREVRIRTPDMASFRDRTPVLVDDIVSSGTTMKQAMGILRDMDFRPAYCLAIHALCTRRTARAISDSSAGFLTSNTIPNADAAFDVAPLVAQAISSAAPRDCAARPALARP